MGLEPDDYCSSREYVQRGCYTLNARVLQKSTINSVCQGITTAFIVPASAFTLPSFEFRASTVMKKVSSVSHRCRGYTNHAKMNYQTVAKTKYTESLCTPSNPTIGVALFRPIVSDQLSSLIEELRVRMKRFS